MDTTAATTASDPISPAVSTPTIGVFDSGIGGFTVAGAILRRRPDLGLVYFGDTINMPYGGRSLTQLSRFAKNSIEFLLNEGMDILAVGCNASNSALGQGELKSFGIPVFDLVTSTVEWLRAQPETPHSIALLATEAAIRSGYWERKLREALPELEIQAVATPEYVPLTEAHVQDEYANLAAARKYLQPLLDKGVRTILHGCTHYPLLQSYMEQVSSELSFIDPAECLAEKLLANLRPPQPDARPGRLRLYSSLPGEAFFQAGQRALGRPIREFTSMYIVNPCED